MAAFLTTCALEVVDDNDSRPLFRLLSPLHYWSDVLQKRVIVPEGFETDGPSVPQLAMFTTGYRGFRAAVLHDYLFKQPETFELANDVFKEALKVCKVPEAEALLMYAAVSIYEEVKEHLG